MLLVTNFLIKSNFDIMLKTILFMAFVFYVLNVHSQEKDTVFNDNEISFVVSDLIDAGLHLRYERKIGNNISLGLGSAIKGKKGLVNLSGINTEQIKTNDIFYSGFKIVPEIRYYLNKTQQYSLDGFYFGAYLKYTRYYSNLYGTYIDKKEHEFIIDSDATLQIVTMGFEIGYKLALNKRWNLDFIIAGPGAGFHKYQLKNNTNLPNQFYEELADALEKYSLYDFINSDIKFDLKKARADFLFPAFRYGFSVGYTFK